MKSLIFGALMMIALSIYQAPTELYKYKFNQCVALKQQPTVFNNFVPVTKDEAGLECMYIVNGSI